MYTLRDIIKFLKKQDQELVAKMGIKYPHSYRGYYDQLAFEPGPPMKVKEMVRIARSANGATYTGWKGGEFQMNEYTWVWLANQGETGEALGPILLLFMLGLR